MKKSSERGAVAVEFAVLLPIMLLILVGMVEFGRIFNAQIIVTNSAREGARTMAITSEVARAESATKIAGSSLSPTLDENDIVVSPGCTALDPTLPELEYTTVSVSYEVTPLTGILGPIDIAARGVARCGG
jgi:Flp pilus assembly protein TadG